MNPSVKVLLRDLSYYRKQSKNDFYHSKMKRWKEYMSELQGNSRTMLCRICEKIVPLMNFMVKTM